MTVLDHNQHMTNRGPTNDGDYETPRRNPYTESEPPDEVKAKIFKNAPPGYQNLNTRKVGSVKAQIRTIMQVHGKNGLSASQIVSKYKELNNGKETIDLVELNYDGDKDDHFGFFIKFVKDVIIFEKTKKLFVANQPRGMNELNVEEVKKLKIDLRAILMSAGKCGLTAVEIVRDYGDITFGCEIDLEKLGYPGEKGDYFGFFIKFCRDCMRFESTEKKFYAQCDESTWQLQRMINRTKTGRRKRNKDRFGNARASRMVDANPDLGRGNRRKGANGTMVRVGGAFRTGMPSVSKFASGNPMNSTNRVNTGGYNNFHSRLQSNTATQNQNYSNFQNKFQNNYQNNVNQNNQNQRTNQLLPQLERPQTTLQPSSRTQNSKEMPYRMQKTYATGIRKFKMENREFKVCNIDDITFEISNQKKTVCSYQKYGFNTAEGMLKAINGVRVVNGNAYFEESNSMRETMIRNVLSHSSVITLPTYKKLAKQHDQVSSIKVMLKDFLFEDLDEYLRWVSSEDKNTDYDAETQTLKMVDKSRSFEVPKTTVITQNSGITRNPLKPLNEPSRNIETKIQDHKKVSEKRELTVPNKSSPTVPTPIKDNSVPKLDSDQLKESTFFIYKTPNSKNNEFQAINWSKQHLDLLQDIVVEYLKPRNDYVSPSKDKHVMLFCENRYCRAIKENEHYRLIDEGKNIPVSQFSRNEVFDLVPKFRKVPQNAVTISVESLNENEKFIRADKVYKLVGPKWVDGVVHVDCVEEVEDVELLPIRNLYQ